MWQRGDRIALGNLHRIHQTQCEIKSTATCLDVIPGEFGNMDWSAEAVEQSAKQSYHNLQVMKDAGLSPIPVFHQGERFDWQQRMLDDAESYIGLSPFSRSHRSDIIAWLDQCFAVLKSTPDVQTHGFGIMSHLILNRYPWTSTDAGTWWRQPGNGKIVVPIGGDYAITPDIVPVTEEQLHLPGHLDRLDDMAVQFVADYLRDAIGIDLAEARYNPNARLRCWALYYKALAMWRGIDIVFGINAHTPSLRHVLHACGVNSHLLSYYDLERGRSADVALAKYLAAPDSHLLHHAHGSRLTVHGEGCGISGVTSSAASWRCSLMSWTAGEPTAKRGSGNLSWPVIVLHLVQSTNGPTTLVLLNYRAVPSTITRT